MCATKNVECGAKKPLFVMTTQPTVKQRETRRCQVLVIEL